MKEKTILTIAITILAAVTIAGGAVGLKGMRDAKKLHDEIMASETQGTVENNEEAEQPMQAEDSNQGEIIASSDNEEKSDTKEAKTPNFLYFVSEDDANYDEALKVFEELKKEHGDKVNFELKNITQNPEFVVDFKIVEGNTPALILDYENGLGLKMKTTDKATLEEEIEKAFAE